MEKRTCIIYYTAEAAGGEGIRSKKEEQKCVLAVSCTV